MHALSTSRRLQTLSTTAQHQHLSQGTEAAVGVVDECSRQEKSPTLARGGAFTLAA